MLPLSSVHHVAVICSDYKVSRKFYTEILGLEIISEQYRKERDSWKLDLKLGETQIELFSFPDPPPRATGPEACGLRHLAFATADIDKAVLILQENSIQAEEMRRDELTGKRFTFFRDPDDLPIELYEL